MGFDLHGLEDECCEECTHWNKEEVREQIQENIRTYLDEYEIPQPCMDDLCQIVVDNFKELVRKSNG